MGEIEYDKINSLIHHSLPLILIVIPMSSGLSVFSSVTDIKYTSLSKLLLQQRAVECIPLGPLNENERDDLVYLVDQLRRVGLTFDTHTIDPYPIK